MVAKAAAQRQKQGVRFTASGNEYDDSDSDEAPHVYSIVRQDQASQQSTEASLFNRNVDDAYANVNIVPQASDGLYCMEHECGDGEDSEETATKNLVYDEPRRIMKDNGEKTDENSKDNLEMTCPEID